MGKQSVSIQEGEEEWKQASTINPLRTGCAVSFTIFGSVSLEHKSARSSTDKSATPTVSVLDTRRSGNSRTDRPV